LHIIFIIYVNVSARRKEPDPAGALMICCLACNARMEEKEDAQ
jgi:hypothetical protein